MQKLNLLIKGLLVCLLCLFCSIATIAQTTNNTRRAVKALGKAQSLLARHEYYKAISVFKNLTNPTTEYSAKKGLADCYREIRQFDSASVYYAKLHTADPKDTSVAFYYAQTLIANADYNSPKPVLRDLLRAYPLMKRARVLLASCDSEKNLPDETKNTAIQNLSFNTLGNDFSPVINDRDIVYCTPKKGLTFRGTYKGDGQKFINLCSVTKLVDTTNNGGYSLPISLTGDINTSMHEGPACFDGSNLYITRNINKRISHRGFADKAFALGIFKAKLDEGKWVNVTPFQYNGADYSVGHPTISPNGQYLVFISDRNAGTGLTDLYLCRKTMSDWSPPINLGSQVNTSGSEMFPYFGNDSVLYFSTDGRPGFGGLDIFKGNFKDGKLSQIQNIGRPFNSNHDDFGVAMLSAYEGYLSSNRSGGKGADDIYYFKRKRLRLNIRVIEAYKIIPIAGAIVRIKEDKKPLSDVLTDDQGQTSLEFSKQGTFNISASKEGYQTKRVPFDPGIINIDKDTTIIIELIPGADFSALGTVLDDMGNPVEGITAKLKDSVTKDVQVTKTNVDGKYFFPLEPQRIYSVEVDDRDKFLDRKRIITDGPPRRIYVNHRMQNVVLNKKIDLENIYYDFDKADLRPRSVEILERALIIINDNPDIILEISSFTDSRGSDDYNMGLAAERAKSVIAWLNRRGISDDRLSYKIYGEDNQAVPCPDGVNCSEYKHQLNRRTEFKVIDVTY